MKHQVEITFFIENYRKNRHVHQISPAFNFRSRGAKIKWSESTVQGSENLNEAKFEKSKVVASSFLIYLLRCQVCDYNYLSLLLL